jgi:hypothetical protein
MPLFGLDRMVGRKTLPRGTAPRRSPRSVTTRVNLGSATLPGSNCTLGGIWVATSPKLTALPTLCRSSSPGRRFPIQPSVGLTCVNLFSAAYWPTVGRTWTGRLTAIGSRCSTKIGQESIRVASREPTAVGSPLVIHSLAMQTGAYGTIRQAPVVLPPQQAAPLAACPHGA